MEKAFLGRLAQRGLPVHLRCVVIPAGYPCLIHHFSEEIRAHQRISGYLLSTEISRYKNTGIPVANWTLAATEMFCRRYTLIDTLEINSYGADYCDYILHGEK